MKKFNHCIASAAMLLIAGSASAATVNFELEGSVTRTGNISQSAGDPFGDVTVSGSFDTESLIMVREGVFKIGDIFDVQVAGSLFDGLGGMTVHQALIIDNDAVSGTDMFRLMLRYADGPKVNDNQDYSFRQLSFYIPLSTDSFDADPFSEEGEGLGATLATSNNGRKANFVSVFRNGPSVIADQANINGDVSAFNFAGDNPVGRPALTLPAVPLPATGLMMIFGLGALGAVARRKS